MSPEPEENTYIDPFLTKVEDGVKTIFKKAATLNESMIAKTSAESKCCKVLVAFSGGPDSTALLRSLLDLKPRLDFETHACHVNHGTRGESSEADESFCRQTAESWDVPLIVRKVKEPGSRSEENLRNIRYAHLCDVAAEINASLIATGHTRDDQIETFLFRLFRGAATFGLVCMDSARKLDEKIVLARPLLAISRKECVDFLKRRQIEAVHDASNEDTEYSRNYLRQEVIPLIDKRFPGFQLRLDRLRRLVESDEEYLLETTRAWLSQIIKPAQNEGEIWDLDALKKIPMPLLRRAFAQGLRGRDIEVSFEKIKQLCVMVQLNDQGPLSLSDDWQVRIKGSSLLWQERTDSVQAAQPAIDLDLNVPGMTILAQLGKAVKAESWDKDLDPEFPPATANEALVDLCSVDSSLKVRYRRPGDVIRPFGMQQFVKLKKYIHTHKPPGWAPIGPTIVIADRDEVLWVPGVGLSEKLRVTESPSHKLSILDLAGDDTAVC